MDDEYSLYNQHIGSVKVSNISRGDLKNLIKTGEGSFLEFKRKIASPEKIAREIAAFANTKGGTILIGVDDNGDLIGVEGYLEEEFWLHKAAHELCVPAADIQMELFHYGKREIMIVKVKEAEDKPVFVKGEKRRKVYIRAQDESIEASEERIEIMKNRSSDEGVTFEYGEQEQLLFRFLNEYAEITIERCATLLNVTTYRASRILITMVSANILSMYEKDGIEYYTFA